MLGFISAYNENETCLEKEKISFVSISKDDEETARIEIAPVALAFARKFNLKKVYLFYGKDKKLVYDYSI